MTDRPYDPNYATGPDWVYADPSEDELEAHRAAGPYIGETKDGAPKLLRGSTDPERRWQGELSRAFAMGSEGQTLSESSLLVMWECWRKLHLSRYGKAPERPKVRT